MTTYLSIENHSAGWVATFFRLSKKMVQAYCFSVFVYYIIIYRSFDFAAYIKFLLTCSITSPHYFVSLYLQLLLVSKGLWCVVKYCRGKYEFVYESIVLIVITVISSFTTNDTNIFDIAVGGGKLFGGTYLILFYLGMLFMKHYNFLKNIFYKQGELLTVKRKKLWFISGISIILGVVWWCFECIDNFGIDSKLPFGEGLNPPSLTSTIMALLVLIAAYGTFTLLEQYKQTKNISRGISYVGGYSMYIFLYHRLFEDYFLNQITFNNIWMKRLVYCSVMIGAPILIGITVNMIRGWCKKVADYSNSQIMPRNQSIN